VAIMAEQLLLYDKVLLVTSTFETLCMLLRWMTWPTLKVLLEQDALAFVRLSGVVGYVPKSTQEAHSLAERGLVAVVGRFDEHGVPHRHVLPTDRLVTDTLRQCTEWSTRSINSAVRRIVDHTVELNVPELARLTVPETYMDVQESAILKQALEFDPVDWEELTQEEAAKFVRIADVNLKLHVASEVQAEDIHMDTLAEKVVYAKLGRVLHQAKQDSWHALCKNRRMPDLTSLVAGRGFTFSQVCSLRGRAATRRFRGWFHSHAEDPDNIVSEYIDTLLSPKTNDRTWVKAVRLIASEAVEPLVTAALALLGIPLPEVGGTVADLAVGAVDSFALDRILEGWQPKVFLEDTYRREVE